MVAEWVSAGAVVCGVAFEAWRRWRKFDRGFQTFLNDWNGKPARPGVAEVKGVMERLADQDAQLSFIKHELSFNSGLSVKDVVNRMERKMNEGT